MLYSLRLAACVVIALFAGFEAWPIAPATVAPQIVDNAKFFDPAAVKKADERIREIYLKYDRDVLIETFAGVPANDLAAVKTMDKNKRADYFTHWAKDRVAQRAVNGVYVLICKEPRFLRAGIVEKQPHQFPPGFSTAVEETIMKEFKEGRFDEGLDNVVRLIEDKLAKPGK